MIALSDVIGLIGVTLTLIAYFLLSINKIKAHAMMYPTLNAVGSLMILCSLYYHWNLSAFIMETCWALISFYGMVTAWLLIRKSITIED